MGFVGNASDFEPRAAAAPPPGLASGDLEAVARLMRAMQARDPEEAMHARRVAALCALLAERLDWSRREVWLIWVAAHLHDVGKLEIAGAEGHVLAGQRMLAWRRSSSLFGTAAAIAGTHHERFDGGGHPLGLAGEEIPLAGRIAAVADAFDALLSDRPYRRALELSDAVQVMLGGRGSQFDPAVVDALLADLPEAVMIRSGFGESESSREAHSLVSDLLAEPVA